MDYFADEETVVTTDTRSKEYLIPKFKVILINDDYTTKDFVVLVLKNIFHKNTNDAILIMETVHTNGSAVVGVYTYDIATTLVKRTT